MLAALSLSAAAALAFARVAPARRNARVALGVVVLAGLLIDGWPGPIELHAPPGRLQLPPVKDAVVLELPLDHSAVATSAMYRFIDHRRPLISGYSGHFPAFYRILSSAVFREDPSAILYFTAARPLIITVNHRAEPTGWMAKFIASLPGVVEHGGSSAGSVFVLPARPRPRVAPLGAALAIVATREEERQHVVLDLGRTQLVRAVGFNVRWHYEQLAPRMEVEASDDGKQWRSVWLDWTGGLAVAGAIEAPQTIPIRIPVPDVATRYLRIHPVPAWMLAELTVY